MTVHEYVPAVLWPTGLVRCAICGGDEPSAGSPVTAGVPDTAEIRARHYRERPWGNSGGGDRCATCNDVPWPCQTIQLLDALDAARGELVTARAEIEALRRAL